MLTRQHTQTIAQLLEAKDAGGIHKLLSHLSVADCKKGKALVGSLLADVSRKDVNTFLSIYTELLNLDLNLYFNTFVTTLSGVSSNKELWGEETHIKRIGELLSKNRPYYRQKVIEVMLKGLKYPFDPNVLFEAFSVDKVQTRLKFLIEADSLYSIYIAFRTIVNEDIETEHISKLVHRILSNQDSTINFNIRESVANFITHYFNGVKTSYIFTKKLETATFSYADKSFESFLKTILPSSRIDTYLKGI